MKIHHQEREKKMMAIQTYAKLKTKKMKSFKTG
jgi:hypothetical protein